MIGPSIRLATKSDLDDLAWVLIAASPGDPNYLYRSPRRDDYPEDFAAQCRLKCAEYLDTNKVVVYEGPLLSDPEKRRVVAFSVWERSSPRKQQAGHGHADQTLDLLRGKFPGAAATRSSGNTR